MQVQYARAVNGGAGRPAYSPEDDPRAWAMNVTLYADSFENLQAQAVRLLDQIAKAKNYMQLPTSGGGGGGGDSVMRGFEVKWRSPIEHRVAQLRKEADELEAGLNGKKR